MLRLNRVTPQFRFNVEAQRYVASNGQFVARETVKAASEAVASQAIRDMESAAVQFNADGDLTAFINRMRLNIRRAMTANGVIGAGGIEQMTPSKWGRNGQKIREQYAYLTEFGKRIQSGELSPERIIWNAKLYGNAPRVFFEYAQALNHFDELGHDEVANIYGGNEHHCDGPGSCKEMDELGFVSPDDPNWLWPGERLCQGNDHCGVRTRKSE